MGNNRRANQKSFVFFLNSSSNVIAIGANNLFGDRNP